MKVIIVGLGIQGQKRKLFAGDDVSAIVDPVNPSADYKNVRDVPLDIFDAALLCIPDDPKLEIIRYLVSRGKHVLVEKPLLAENSSDLVDLLELVRLHGVCCYTAYNHRYEPHFVRMRNLLASGTLGRIYTLRMFYGNGTARLVRESEWRDTGAGVLPDLGSHLLDSLSFWFPQRKDSFELICANRFENRAYDHVIFGTHCDISIQLEVTLLSWRNHFYCDVVGENGSAHIESLCKWGPSKFTVRERQLPSGRPSEEVVTLVKADPTWRDEYLAFKEMCANGTPTNLENDIWINDSLKEVGSQLLNQ